MKKSDLSKKILCSILAASTFGVMYTGTSYAAKVYGEEPTDKPITNDIIVGDNHSGKFIMGQGNLNIQTTASIGNIISSLGNDSSLSGILSAVRPSDKYAPIVIAVGGEGQFDTETQKLLGSDLGKLIDKNVADGMISKVNNFNTIGENNSALIEGNINTTIGGEMIDGKVSQPVVIGFSGGDMSINTGATGELKAETTGMASIFISLKDDISLKAQKTTIERTGNINTNLNSGNIIGGVGSSTAVSLGNIDVKSDWFSDKGNVGTMSLKGTDIKLDGDSTTILNGSVNTNINNGTNIVAFANGGGAISIGGTSKSIVNGNTNIDIKSTVNNTQLEGMTVGIAGGGAAVSTIGGNATSEVNGTTTINANNALSIGIIGSGVAASIDAAGLADKGNDNGVSDLYLDISMNGLTPSIKLTNDENQRDIEVYIGKDEEGKRIYDGGTAIATTGDTNINLTGTTTAAGVIGSGMAVSSHSYVGRFDTDTKGQPLGSSTATVNSGKSTININLDTSISSDESKAELINGIKDLSKILNTGNTNDIISSMQSSINKLADKGAVLAVTGGGIAVAGDDANSNATVTNEGADINLQNGYIVGTFGGGVATSTNNANATSKTTGDININVNGNTEAIGIFGNGAAYFTGSSQGGTFNLDGKSTVTAENTNININSGSVDGVFGGGLAVDDSQADVNNASVTTNGTSTINVNGGAVNELNYDALKGIMGNPSTDSVTNGNYLAAVKEAANGVAIVAGGVAASGGASADVNTSVVNINNGEVNGDVLGGGVAVYGYTPNEENKDKVGANIENSTINLNGGKIDGSVYAGGVALAKDYANKDYTEAKSNVANAVINLAGSEVTGEISGSVKEIKDEQGNNINTATVTSSTLNISGNNTVAPLTDTDKSKINGFNAINVDANSVTTLKDITAGNTTALIDGNKGSINVADGAKLDITYLAVDKENSYFIVSNYDKANSKLWNNSSFVYDRTENYAYVTSNDGDNYSIGYKDLSNLTEIEQDNAVNDFVGSVNGVNRLRNIIRDMIKNNNAVKANSPGAKNFFKDLATQGNSAIQASNLINGIMIGEISGATNTNINFAQDMADIATLRLSFTQDDVTGEHKIDEKGNIWATYIHNKHEGSGFASSFGNISFDSSYDGIMVGSDFAKKGKVQSGIAFAYANGDGSGMNGKNDFDLWGLTLYGNVKNDDTNVIADIGYSEGSHDLTSYLSNGTMTADRDISVFSVGVRAEKLYTNGSTQIVPYTGLRYMSVDPSGYTSYYNGAKAFDYDADRQNIWTVPLGVSLRHESISNSGWKVTPKLDLAYIWAFGDTDNTMNVGILGATDSLKYTVMDDGSWYGALGIEASKDAWSYGLGYSYQKGDDAKSNKWFVNATYSF